MKIEMKYLRPLKREYLDSVYREFDANRHSLVCAEVEDAMVLPPADGSESWQCAVRIGPSRLHPYSIEDEEYDMQSLPEWNDVEKEEVSAIYCGYLNPHWGHFLTDSLPQLWPLFCGWGEEVDKIVYACRPGEENCFCSNIGEAFRLAGVADKVEIISSPRRYRSLLIPQRAISPRRFASVEALGVFDAIAEAAMREGNGENGFERVLLSRGKFGKAAANEIGLDEIEGLFENGGYRPVSPERIGLGEMIRILRGAKQVVAVQGTLPHNMLFAKQGAELVVIEKSAAINNFQPAIDILRDLSVTYVDANAQWWTVSGGLGPFILYPGKWLRSYASDAGLEVPFEWCDSKKRHALWRFLKLYRRHYSRRWELAEWELPEIGLLREAYLETMTDFGSWIRGERPITPADRFNLRSIAKRLLKKH